MSLILKARLFTAGGLDEDLVMVGDESRAVLVHGGVCVDFISAGLQDDHSHVETAKSYLSFQIQIFFTSNDQTTEVQQKLRVRGGPVDVSGAPHV